MLQSLLASVGIRPLCLSRAVKKRLTRLTLTLRVVAGFDSSGCSSGKLLAAGGASADGVVWARAAVVEKTSGRQSRAMSVRRSESRRRAGMEWDIATH